MIPSFLMRAVLAGILTGFVTSLIGVPVVLRRMAFFGSGIAHVSFAGIGLALFFGFDPFLISLILAMGTAIVLGYLARRGVHEDVGMGILFSLSMAIGIIFISLRGKYTGDILAYLFGDILAVTENDLKILSGVSIMVLLFTVLFGERLVYMTLDEEFSKVMGIPIVPIYFLYLLILATVVVVSIKVLGIILVSAMLVIPVATTMVLFRNYKKMFTISPLFSIGSVFLGLTLSYYFDIPSGASIVAILGGVFFTTLIVRGIRNG